MKLLASVRSLNSRWLAICCAVGYLVVSAVIGTTLLVRPAEPAAARPGDRAPGYVSELNPNGTSTSAVPQGFQRVHGPADVQTVIPDGWRVARAGGPGAMRATDPSDGSRVVGYGGATAAHADLATVHLSYEIKFAERTSQYKRIGMNRATYAGNPAIEWEYQHNDGTGIQHVRTLFWVVRGVEYFIFASCPREQWPRMRPVYDAMVANSRP